eukprot:5069386-Heterocapsa_arctica.AAC.1
MAIDSGLSVSSYRSIYSDESRKAKVASMLNSNASTQASRPNTAEAGVGDDTEFYDTMDNPIFAKNYDEK